MIHEFRIKNLLSFKDEQTLSFEATSDKSFDDIFTVEVKPSLKLLKLAVLYGPNASGKTNLLRALAALRRYVLKPSEDKFQKIKFSPFLFDDSSKDGDGEFYLSFFIEGKRFIYTLILNKKLVKNEKLIFYQTSQPSTLFERKYEEDQELSIIEFGDKLEISKKDRTILEGNTIKNSTLLSIYLKSNVSIPLLDMVSNWFKNSFMSTVSPKTDLTGWTSKKVEESEVCRSFVLEALGEADFNISNIIFDEKETELNDDLAKIISNSNIPNEQKEKVLEEGKIKSKSISFIHSTEKGEFKLPFRAQSNGTQRYYGLSGILNSLLSANKFIAIDEIETSLHYDLVNHFIKTFLVNSQSSQLLFTTHDISILMSEFLRRDAIWLCEKNEMGGTELYSASEIGLHKNQSLFNAYKIGKLGAKPKLGSIYLEKEVYKNGKETEEVKGTI